MEGKKQAASPRDWQAWLKVLSLGAVAPMSGKTLATHAVALDVAAATVALAVGLMATSLLQAIWARQSPATTLAAILGHGMP